MSWKDKAKAARQGASNIPKIEVDYHFEVKMHDGVPVFRYYDKSKEEVVFRKEPLNGVFIGDLMVCESFSSQLGRNGGTYRSAYYINNENVVMIDPVAAKVAARGTMADIEHWALENTDERKVSKKKVILLAIDSNILIAVTTNMSLFIDQNKVEKDRWIDYEMVLTPSVYNPNDPEINKKTHKILGPLSAKNPPAYAKMSMGKLLSDSADEEYNLSARFDMFNEFVEYLRGGNQATNDDELDKAKEEASQSMEKMADDYTSQVERDIEAQREEIRKEEEPSIDEPDDDLPF